VLQNALARLEAEIQAVKLRVPPLELINHAQALEVVLKTFALRVVLLEACIERVLPRMAKRGVPEVMRKADGLRKLLIERKAPCNGARNLRHLEAVRKPSAVQIALMVYEDLCLVQKLSERSRMNNSIAITLKL
jgi:hypothetical protein